MGSSNVKTGLFIACEKCGKRLIERKKNGIFHFVFGKPGEGSSFVPVEMYVQGNIKIKCLRRTCGHWQTLNYFPSVFQSSENLETDCDNKEKVKNKNLIGG